jgi:hypothetical protein
MINGIFKKIGTGFVLTPALLVATLPAGAQQLHRRGDDRGRFEQRYDRHDNGRRYEAPRYRPAYRGNVYVAPAYGYGYTTAPAYGYATAPAYGDYGYQRYDDGIGPGKGAAIGAVGGAVLGALLGGGKGAVIGGAAGAGVGAIAGQAAQDNRYSRYGY